MMLILQHLSYIHPDKYLLFEELDFVINKYSKSALVGNNGSGKSTLLKIIAGSLQPSSGTITIGAAPYYVPQAFGQYDHLTVAEGLKVSGKLKALKAILEGNTTEENYTLLDDDWMVEERCREALQHWQLNDIDLDQRLDSLSGGQKTRVFLAGIAVHQPDLILLDEPSNHLDTSGRQLLYDWVRSAKATLLVVSHDRTLLNMLDMVCELNKRGIIVYGGNYDFYLEQKLLQDNALNADIKSREKELRKAREKERETMERQQKLDARGRKKQEKAGLPTISMNTFRNNAEKSTARTKGIHADKIEGIARGLKDLREALPDKDKMKLGFDHSVLHKGKVLVTLSDVNHCYEKGMLWKQALDISIISGERIALKGDNGSGKTTLLKIILGTLKPRKGTVQLMYGKAIYMDQEYSLINNELTVYGQAQQFNEAALQEYEIKIKLDRFLFTKEDWDKPCAVLSGGEKMRLLLCCLTISNKAPDMLILDEPTNNLDIQNIEILTAAVNEYQGTLIVISHDSYFLKEIRTERVIMLKGEQSE